MNEQDMQWAIDQLEIRNAIASLAVLSDLGEIEEWGSYFTEDAVYTVPSGNKNEGREAIIESGRQRRAHGTHGPGSGTRHFSGSVRVTSTGPDTAEAQHYMLMYQDLAPLDANGDADAKKSPTLLVLGYYVDTFRRTSDGWKVERRALTTSNHTDRQRAIMASW